MPTCSISSGPVKAYVATAASSARGKPCGRCSTNWWPMWTRIKESPSHPTLGRMTLVPAQGRNCSTKETLQELIETRFRDLRFIAVSNREPYIHQYKGSNIECIQPASGLTVALDPILRATGGTWVARSEERRV